jgi:hypothetical protein
MPVRSMSNYGVPCTDIKAVVLSSAGQLCSNSGDDNNHSVETSEAEERLKQWPSSFLINGKRSFRNNVEVWAFCFPPLWTCGASLVLCQTPDGLTLQKCREFPFQLHWRPQNQIRILLYHLPEEVVEQSWNQMRLNK